MEKDSKMNIYSVADIHGRQDRLDLIKNHVTLLKPDVLVIAGDITGHHELLSLIGQLNDLPIPVLAVRGNMDSQEVEKLLEQYPNISSLHKKKVTINGVSFVGLGGTIPVPFCSKICLREKRLIEETDYLIERIPYWCPILRLTERWMKASEICMRGAGVCAGSFLKNNPGCSFAAISTKDRCGLSCQDDRGKLQYGPKRGGCGDQYE